MDEQDREKARGAQSRSVDGLSAEELARTLALPIWTAQEAAAVLLEQRRSGRSVMSFAALHGISGCRLYYWRKRLPTSEMELAEVPDPRAQPEPLASMTTVDEELELTSESLRRALARELDPEAAGDRQVRQYVMRAVREEDKLWSVFELRASGSVLLAVVRWAGWRGPLPYSLVELHRTKPAVCWRVFATLKETEEARDKHEDGGNSPTGVVAMPLLLPVQVRGLDRTPALATARESAGGPGNRAVTVELPSGVRIRMANGADPELVRTVLGTTLGVSS